MLWFLFSFAWQNVTERYTRRTSLVVVITIAGVCAVSLGADGFIIGLEQVKRHRLAEDPLALCLWASPTKGGYLRLLTPEIHDRLEQEVQTELKDGSRLRGVYLFREVTFTFLDTQDEVAEPKKGRTIQIGPTGDLLFKSRPLRGGRPPFKTPNDQGVIVSPRLLKELGYDPEAPPTSLKLQTGDQVILHVPVRGVTQKELPQEYAFVVPEQFGHFLDKHRGNPQARFVMTGPIPNTWPSEWENFSPKVQHIFELEGLKCPSKKYAGAPQIHKDSLDRPIWQLESTGTENDPNNPLPTLERWSEILNRLLEAMPDDPNRLAFLEFDLREQLEPLPPLPQNYNRAAIYVRDLDDLRPAADATERIRVGDTDLWVNRDVINQVTSIGEDLEFYLRVLKVSEVVVVLVAVLNIFLIQALRAQHQIAEMGMLKAMGMTNRALALVCLFEGALLGVPGALLGILLGLGGGVFLARFCYDTPEERRLGFWVSWPLAATVLLAAVAVCLGTSWLTNGRARRDPPSVSLRTN